VVPLSVLDLSPVAAGSSGAQSLRNSLDLARLCDGLGFTRYWVAEHHNLPSIASSAPDIMIGQIAAVTQHMRIGSGGVMLPNHAPLMVAERFKVLEALFPGRIDLGLGRAPGTDPVTSYALRRRQDTGGDDDFLQRFQELVLFENNAFPQNHPFRSIRAMPQDVALPPIWLLGSSGYSAQLAAMVGAGYSFAHHFADHDPVEAMLSYREQYKPSEARATPYAILACAVVCADSDAEAERLASTIDLNFVRRRQGQYLPLFAGRARIDRAQPRAALRRQQGHGAGAARADDRGDESGRGHGHDHALRPRRAPALVRAARRGVRAGALVG